jgi:hypothetical protein
MPDPAPSVPGTYGAIGSRGDAPDGADRPIEDNARPQPGVEQTSRPGGDFNRAGGPPLVSRPAGAGVASPPAGAVRAVPAGRPPTGWPPGGDESTRRGRRQVELVRGRRSRRIVRRIDTWTVLKVSAVFYLCAWLIVLVAVILLWFLASAFGSIHDIEKSIRTLFDYSSYKLHASAVFYYTAAGGFLLAVLGTLVNTLIAVLYNLISDVAGGLQVIVLAEDERFPDV